MDLREKVARTFCDHELDGMATERQFQDHRQDFLTRADEFLSRPEVRTWKDAYEAERLIPKIVRGLQTTLETIGSSLRKTWFRLQYPGLEIDPSASLGRGVRISVQNGARMTIGARTVIEPNCQLASQGDLVIGQNGFVGQGSIIAAVESISIGDDALIAANVTIRDQNHSTGAKPYRSQPLVAGPISIGSNVWIGAGAVILKGVSIGDNAVIGANAVVTKSVEANHFATGVPAVVRHQ